METEQRPKPEKMGEEVPLAPLTTLEIGGCAQHLLTAETEDEIVGTLRWAREQDLQVTVLGGGSNVVVGDHGVEGVVLRVGNRGRDVRIEDGFARLTVAAGEPWDGVVEHAVAEKWAGLECLSGIPGSAGATPIQNVGAYGQDVANVIDRVRILDCSTLQTRSFNCDDMAFGYRSSRLKREPGHYVVLDVTFALTVNGVAKIRHPELTRAVGGREVTPPLKTVREAVLGLRRTKSMVIDEDDPNHRSVGSFFVNPVLGIDEVLSATQRSVESGIQENMPVYPIGGGQVKVSAAWLIEKAGFSKGFARGPVGLSSGHSLALINRGGATAEELIALASEIRSTVHRRFGILLQPEPVFLGFNSPSPLGDPAEF